MQSFLPASPEYFRLFRLIVHAFKKRLVFKVVSKGQSNQIVSTGIQPNNNAINNELDPELIKTVKEHLSLNGITESDLPWIKLSLPSGSVELRGD